MRHLIWFSNTVNHFCFLSWILLTIKYWNIQENLRISAQKFKYVMKKNWVLKLKRKTEKKKCVKIEMRHFLWFSNKFFWQFFSWNQSCQQLKIPNPQHFHEFFTPKKSPIFLVKSKLSTVKNSNLRRTTWFFHWKATSS